MPFMISIYLLPDSKRLNENVIKALSFCQMSLMGNCINMHLKAHIYACFRDVVYGFISICFFRSSSSTCYVLSALPYYNGKS